MCRGTQETCAQEHTGYLSAGARRILVCRSTQSSYIKGPADLKRNTPAPAAGAPAAATTSTTGAHLWQT